MSAESIYYPDVNNTFIENEKCNLTDYGSVFADIPDHDTARFVMQSIFSGSDFSMLCDDITNRIGCQFLNWNQGKPVFLVTRNTSTQLKKCMDTAGKKLPLAVVAQVSYGTGAGHPYFGIHRNGIFPEEEAHTYMYHAVPGLVLKNRQASDYFRIDHLPSKPLLYAFWILTKDITDTGSHEIHRRWSEHRYQNHNPLFFDCSVFVSDIARHMASIGNDPNNPFTYNIPSNTIYQGRSEGRGMRAILRNTHRPPALMLLSLDEATYADITVNSGSYDSYSKIIYKDNNVFNVTSQ